MNGAASVNPRITHRIDRRGLNFGLFIYGSIITMKVIRPEQVSNPRNPFLALCVGLHVKEYIIKG